jgi:two-component system, OmpR family, phosphate regulon sensor histidine kinase PhoR
MNRRVLTIIIALTSISLIAALVTQLLWVKDAGLLKEDQFNNSVRVAMRTVINEINDKNKSYTYEMLGIDSVLYWEHINLLSVLHPRVLDSLLQEEFRTEQIKGPYNYGIFRSKDSLFILGNYEGKTSELICSPIRISLTCLCQSDNYWLSAYFPEKRSILFSELFILPLMSGLFLMVLVFSFFFTIYMTIRQKKLADMKTDFVNNMTHEFKTPISTISVTSEILAKEQVVNSPEKVTKYARIIFDENNRLRNMVERVLQIALIDRDEFSLRLKESNVHEIITECIENFKIQISERKGRIKTKFDAKQPVITIDRDHLSNILNNLFDNANKYSPENPHITITTSNLDGHLLITVEDKGIGISKENQKDVFKKFHRIQTGNIHNVKGFGIGLFYVKTMMEKMGGKIELQSEPNKGSSFTLSFPV